jgi:hypothetical protein
MKSPVIAAAPLLAAGAAFAKLPTPSDEAKARAAEAAERAAHAGKVANFQLCRSQDMVASAYHASLEKAGKPVPAAAATPPCADPGPFVATAPK